MSRRTDWPEPPERLAYPVVDNHTHLETVLAETDAGGWRQGGPGPNRGAEERAADDDNGVAGHLERAAAAGVARLVQIGCDLESAAWTDAAVLRYPQLLGGVALHPNEAPLHAGVREIGPDGLEPVPSDRHGVDLDTAVVRIADFARDNERIRVVGETGLDYFRAGEQGRAVQREAFRAHIALAKELDLVLQIHDREAHEDVVTILDADGAPERTVLHCFSGDVAMARACVERGWYLSFAGTVTFRGADHLRESVRVAGPGRVLVESDAPYLAPHPYRGRPNAPYLVAHTMRTVAAELGLDLDAACRAVDRTSSELYGPW